MKHSLYIAAIMLLVLILSQGYWLYNIYNAEKYLDKSLSSLTQQTFQDFEVLLINDGSKDNSAAICKKYSLIDQRFKLFNKENGGSASARQMGMDNLCGRYCIVCDADDWVEANMLEQLYLATNNEQVDMVISDFFVNYDNGKQRIISHKGIDLKARESCTWALAKNHG